MWVEILLFLFLAVCAVFDGLRKQIPLVVVWLGILTAICLRINGIMGEESVTAALLSLIPGMGFFLLSFLTREKVGYGDGWVLMMIGLFSGFSRCFLILLIGLLLESMAAVVLLLLKKKHRDKEIPFSPFMIMGMGVTLCF